MKKHILFILVLTSCSRFPLTRNEVLSMKSIGFNEPELKMDYEPTNLRIDVFRQHTTNYINETIIYEEPVDYHPLGFNMGNGLFYDMNGNLSFRIDHLLDFSTDEPFEIRLNNWPNNQKAITQFVYKNNEFSKIAIHQRNFKSLFEKVSIPDSAVIIKKNNFYYAISQTDTSIAYYFRERKPLKIYKLDQNRYYRARKRGNRKYTNYDGVVTLGRTFTIQLSEDRNYIFINTPNRTKQNKKPILYIRRDAGKIVVYTNTFRGTRIELKENGLIVSGHNTRPVQYEKIKKSL